MAPKIMEKEAWRLMIKAVSGEAARFAGLKIFEARDEDLLTEADE